LNFQLLFEWNKTSDVKYKKSTIIMNEFKEDDVENKRRRTSRFDIVPSLPTVVVSSSQQPHPSAIESKVDEEDIVDDFDEDVVICYEPPKIENKAAGFDGNAQYNQGYAPAEDYPFKLKIRNALDKNLEYIKKYTI
jgi:hypothetical protein